MKTIFKPLLFAILVMAGLKGSAQCASPFYNYNFSTGGLVNFYNYTTYDTLDGPGTTYVWNFGDGDTLISSAYEVDYTYPASGAYVVSLRVSGGSCPDSTYSQTLNVNLCWAAAAYDSVITGFGGYTFNALNLPYLPGSTVQWSFGDGGTSTSATPSHSYAASGGYNVTLIVTDPTLSCADTATTYLDVTLCNYPVSIDTSILGFNPVDIQFQPSPLNAAYSYAWTFGDGGTGTGQTVTHNYTASGTYATGLTITDATTGCTLSVSSTNGINLCGDVIGFYNYGNGPTQNFSSYGYDTINGTANIASYNWTFAGATPSTANTANVSGVVFPAVGTYSVCLYATTTGGCVDTMCQTITVTPPVYSITGVAAKSGASGFAGTMYLIVQDSTGHLALLDSVVNPVDTFGFDSATNGYGFGFYNLPVDTYYVKAALSSGDPDYANYLPTYFGNVLTWGTATPIALTTNNAIADIDLVAGTNTGGPGFVGGYVSQGAGLVLGGANNLSKSAGSPLQGVQINLLNSTGGAVAYTYTDVNGKYTFANLALGTYSIYAEQLNKIPNPLDFTLTQTNPTDTGADITINSRTATGVNSVDNVEISDVYPNPVSSTVQLLIGCKHNANATLKLVDVLGRTAFTQQTQLVTGQNTVEINMETMAAGVYQLVIQTGASQLGYKLVKAK